jgi:uncharacterized protein (TIGR02145 family)
MGISSSYNESSYGSSPDIKYRGVCPQGWHIPNNNELKALIDYVENDKNCSSCAGKYLKADGGWTLSEGNNGDGSGTNAYGFSALPGGFRVLAFAANPASRATCVVPRRTVVSKPTAGAYSATAVRSVSAPAIRQHYYQRVASRTEARCVSEANAMCCRLPQ